MTQLPQFEALYDRAACGLVLTNPQGVIHIVNSTFCQWLGYEDNELVGECIQQFFTMGARIFHHTHWTPLMQMQGSVAEVQMSLRHRDGHVIPMLINAVRRHHGDQAYDELAFFVSTDRHQYERELLAARKTAELSVDELSTVQRELNQSRDILSLAMHGAKMGVWSCTLSNPPRWWWSRELESLLGLAEGAFAGTAGALEALVHPEDLSALNIAFENARTSAADYCVEFRCRHASGQWLLMESSGRATHNAEDATETLIGVVTDISARRQVDDELRRLNAQLSVADRRKDEFLATLAHELRNPMAPMRNVLELFKLKPPEENQLNWGLHVLERQMQQMTHLIDDLMEISRITRGRLELRTKPVHIQSVIRDAVSVVRSVMDEQKHTLRINLPEKPIILDADLTRLMQIVVNLLTNAAKYTPESGEIFLSLAIEDAFATLRVKDSGIGIPQEELENVFQMFSQLTPAIDRAKGGLGIGLALVRGLVELHGGTITARSEGAGHGSEFIVHLPLPQKSLTLAHTEVEKNDLRSGSGRILVVDDNIDAAESLALALQMLGYTTCAAHSGAHALQRAYEFAPNVVLLDIGLPDINGYEIAKALRTKPHGEQLQLIAVTGWGQDKDKARAKAAGFDHHMTKPVDFQQLDLLLKQKDHSD